MLRKSLPAIDTKQKLRYVHTLQYVPVLQYMLSLLCLKYEVSEWLASNGQSDGEQRDIPIHLRF